MPRIFQQSEFCNAQESRGRSDASDSVCRDSSSLSKMVMKANLSDNKQGNGRRDFLLGNR